MERESITHRLIYYIKKYTSEKYPAWRTNTIDFIYELFLIMEKNHGINLTFLKSVGILIHYKDKIVCYMRFNMQSFTIYLSKKYLLFDSADHLLKNPFKSKWARAFKITSKEEVDRILYFLRNLDVPKLTAEERHSRTIPKWVKEFVFERDSGKCAACGSKRNICYDHILPYARGGLSDNPKNIQLLCSKCNLKKGDSFRY